MSTIAIAPAVRVTGRPTAPRTSAVRVPRAGMATYPRAGAAPRASASSRGSASSAPGPLRLTRRGRVVVWVLGLALAAGVGGAAMSAQADGPTGATEVRRVVVAPGQTLWAIAVDVATPDEDVRDVVLDLMALNDLASGGLVAGQTIVVPAG